MTYRDYLISTAALTSQALTEAIRKAMLMEDERTAIRLLEHALDVAPELARYGETTDRVEPRPE